jgi:hypothetical protein
MSLNVYTPSVFKYITPLIFFKNFHVVLFEIFIQKSKISSHAQTTLSDKTNYNKINNISPFLLNTTSGQSFQKKSAMSYI